MTQPTVLANEVGDKYYKIEKLFSDKNNRYIRRVYTKHFSCFLWMCCDDDVCGGGTALR